jgi:hypothetical protein
LTGGVSSFMLLLRLRVDWHVRFKLHNASAVPHGHLPPT